MTVFLWKGLDLISKMRIIIIIIIIIYPYLSIIRPSFIHHSSFIRFICWEFPSHPKQPGQTEEKLTGALDHIWYLGSRCGIQFVESPKKNVGITFFKNTTGKKMKGWARKCNIHIIYIHIYTCRYNMYIYIYVICTQR